MPLKYNTIYGIKEASLTIPYHYLEKLHYTFLKNFTTDDEELQSLLDEIKEFLIENY